WGIYYRKSIFSKYGLQPPKTWDDLLRVGTQLKRNNITPFALGNSGKWPAAAWFDYLNLRINGLAFHRELLQGKHSFFDERIEKVLIYWKELIDNGFFISYQDVVDWNEALPFIYHRYAAMILIGNFVSGEFPKPLVQDFEFIPFPIIDSSVLLYEDAPLDVLMVPSNATISRNIKNLVSYVASEQFQTEYNQGMGMISPHLQATLSDGAFIRDGAALLKKASGVAQFFDRDTQNEFVVPALEVFARFLMSGDVSTTQEQLEKLRNQYLKSDY
ncbi:ABC transporter substrate-binding protein, partial [Photobacterium sp. OFAV2-7]|uniref:ABC transporter substrate-binding protein n=1 Tax=Photobacterium sp. OFAV2-7 TaxID=2917748 RepID=UPI001EF70037